jgi:hypothetical protein
MSTVLLSCPVRVPQHIKRATNCQASPKQVAAVFCWVVDNANNWGTDCGSSGTLASNSSSSTTTGMAATGDRLLEVYWTKLHPAGLDSDAELLSGLGVALEDVRTDEIKQKLLRRGTKVGLVM